MVGVLLYLYFLVLGFLYSKLILKNKNMYFCFWIGGILGNLILMVGIVIPSLLFGFTILSHLILAVVSLLPFIFMKRKNNIQESIEDKECLNHKIFFSLVIPFFALMVILLTNYILVPTKDGGFASGQSTYGDLNMHIGFVTSIAEQQKFPPDYVFLSGQKLNYPFFVDMLSSSLYLFGTPIRWAILIPSYCIAFLLIMGFYFVSYKITKRKAASIIAIVLFLLCGGFRIFIFSRRHKSRCDQFYKNFYRILPNTN